MSNNSRVVRRNLNSQKKSQKPQLPRVLKLMPEIQYYDSGNAFSSAIAGTFFNISGIPIGDGPDDRDGSVVHPVHLTVRAFISSSAATFVRVIYGRYLTDMAGGSATQVLELNTSPSNLVAAHNRDYSGQSGADQRIEILYDRLFWIDAATSDPHHFHFEMDLTKSKHPLIRWDNAGASVTPIFGGYFGLYIGSATTASCNQYSRLQYLDA
jgi:hypothetical protein